MAAAAARRWTVADALGEGDRALLRLARHKAFCEDLAFFLLPVLLFAAISWFEPAVPAAVVLRSKEPVQAFQLNIQTAPWHEWALLDGIGESRGKRIVAFREARGGFASVEDLARIPGLPRGWLDAARGHLAATDAWQPAGSAEQ